jgi:ADP-heptose:LPS heptosyltransferase
VDHARSIEDRGLIPFFVRGAELPESWARYFGAFDLFLSYLHDPESVFHDNLRRCSQGRILRGEYRPDESRGLHATACLLEPLKGLGIDAPDPVPRLLLPPASTREDDILPRGQARCLAVHPGSGSESKNWPVVRWNELLRRWTNESGNGLLVIAGEAETGRLGETLRGIAEDRFILAQDLPLLELGYRLSRCQGYLGHDSGITHLAAAVGVRGLVLWGPSNLVVWRPCSENLHVLQPKWKDGLANLGVTEVWDALRQLLHF